ncbi:MAG: Clp protease N-terminal domain-containing protein, partial [Desulfobacterales bacterium]
MRLDKFTIKSQELIENAQSLASQQHHQQIEPEHLLVAMLDEAEGIAGSILNKHGIDPDGVIQELRTLLDQFPGITGAGEIYLSPRTKQILDTAFAEASAMKDQYVSIEHILLAIADGKGGKAAALLSRQGITRESLLKVLMDIRGSQRITDPNPEEK